MFLCELTFELVLVDAHVGARGAVVEGLPLAAKVPGQVRRVDVLV